ncbi:DUF6228 family protein [Rubripirellula obstinata]|nr:DUF6228 family protein [Rubripirellula obstinata]
MDTVTIPSANRASSLTLFDREPEDREQELTHFSVRFVDTDITAGTRVYGYMCGGLLDAFDRIASDWQTFAGPLEWSSLETEFSLTITHDGLGHFTIRTALSRDLHDDGWGAVNHLRLETSQLDRIASDLRAFMGNCS